jgi:hypothetical protein
MKLSQAFAAVLLIGLVLGIAVGRASAIENDQELRPHVVVDGFNYDLPPVAPSLSFVGPSLIVDGNIYQPYKIVGNGETHH